MQESFLRLQVYNFIKKHNPASVFSCEFCEIYQNNFFIEHLRTTGNVLKSQRPLINRNVYHFILFFFKEYFSTYPSCLKCALFRLENYYKFSKCSVFGQLHWLEDTMCNVLDPNDFQNQVHLRKFLGSRIFAIDSSLSTC